MADSQAIDLEERFPSRTPDGRDARLAMLMTAKWRDEIERAIDRIKKPVKRSEFDRWFRKQWYRCQAIRLKRERQLAWEKANRQQTGEHGGDERRCVSRLASLCAGRAKWPPSFRRQWIRKSFAA
jgi:hypothetical protein